VLQQLKMSSFGYSKLYYIFQVVVYTEVVVVDEYSKGAE